MQVLEDRREVCLEEEVAHLRRSGMSAREIARTMGVDEGWVEGLVSCCQTRTPQPTITTEERRVGGAHLGPSQ